jgi:hypothetical protein
VEIDVPHSDADTDEEVRGALSRYAWAWKLT